MTDMLNIAKLSFTANVWWAFIGILLLGYIMLGPDTIPSSVAIGWAIIEVVLWFILVASCIFMK